MSVPQKSFEPAAACPLDGVRVVDMSRLVSGNMVSLQLADFGAEVIKIEDPKKGDPLRAWQTDGVSVHWKVYSRNKKSVALSLREARGRELLLDLAATAQVLIENFRPGTIETMGLGPDILHRRNPGLIILRVSGWGQDGPYRDRPGFGTLVESMSGYAARTGFADREPALPPTALADMVAGLYGAIAVLVALREVESRGGKGQVIDLPLLDPLFSLIATEAAIYRLTGEVRERTGSRSETTSPRNVFRTRDGRYIGISASIQAMAERLFRAVGRADMITDPRFRTNSDRVRNAEACEAPIAAFIAARTLAENMEVFERAEVTAAPVYDIDQFMADPHVTAREILVEVPDTEMGHLPMQHMLPRNMA
jgi:crotonobetainyl-CoA:carnitine CoA-transferase CaiB-like acyl-CoA transferase